MSNMRIQRPEVLRALHLPHFGHGVTGYASILNPINSIVDLLNQHQLKVKFEIFSFIPSDSCREQSWNLLGSFFRKREPILQSLQEVSFPWTHMILRFIIDFSHSISLLIIQNHAAKLQERNLTLQLLKKVFFEFRSSSSSQRLE